MVNSSYSNLKLLMPYHLFIYQILVNSVLFKRPVVAFLTCNQINWPVMLLRWLQ